MQHGSKKIMEENSMMDENPKKLMAVVVVLCLFVVALFGFAPSV